jgi:hypothetical protein
MRRKSKSTGFLTPLKPELNSKDITAKPILSISLS